MLKIKQESKLMIHSIQNQNFVKHDNRDVIRILLEQLVVLLGYWKSIWQNVKVIKIYKNVRKVSEVTRIYMKYKKRMILQKPANTKVSLCSIERTTGNIFLSSPKKIAALEINSILSFFPVNPSID